MSDTPDPVEVVVNNLRYRVGLADAGAGRLRVYADPNDWPYRAGTRLCLRRGKGDEYFRVERAARLGEVLVAVLAPAEPPKPERAYWPPVSGAMGS